MIDINQRLFSTHNDKFVSIDITKMATLIEKTTYWHHIDFKSVLISEDYLKKFGFTTNDEIEYHKNCPNGNVLTILKDNEWTWYYKSPDADIVRIDFINQLQDKYWELAEPRLEKAS